MHKNFVTALVILTVMSLAAISWALPEPYVEQSQQRSSRALNLGLMLDNVDLDGAAAQRTLTINNPAGGYGYVHVEIDRTRVAGTDLTMTCVSTTRESTTPTAQRTTCAFDTSGNCDSVTATRRSTTSVSEELIWTVSVAGFIRTDCEFDSTSAGASDQLSVYGSMVAW